MWAGTTVRVPHSSIHSRTVDGRGEWRLHATGRLAATTPTQAVAGADTTSFTATRDARAATSRDGYYAQLMGLGIELGPAFRSLTQAHRRHGEAQAQLVLPTACAGATVAWAHPALIDGALQAVGLAVPASSDTEHAYLLTEVERIDLVEPLPVRLWCHARALNARDHQPAEWHADVTLRSVHAACWVLSWRRAPAPCIAGGARPRHRWRSGQRTLLRSGMGARHPWPSGPRRCCRHPSPLCRRFSSALARWRRSTGCRPMSNCCPSSIA